MTVTKGMSGNGFHGHDSATDWTENLLQGVDRLPLGLGFLIAAIFKFKCHGAHCRPGELTDHDTAPIESDPATTNWQDANFDFANFSTGGSMLYENPGNGYYDYNWVNKSSNNWVYFLNAGDTKWTGFIMDDFWRNDDEHFDEPYHVTIGWPSQVGSGSARPLPEIGTLLTHDNVTGGKYDDWFFLGPGNDRLDGSGGEDSLYGGSHDDLIYGGAGNDLLRGDYSDAPVILNASKYQWALPTASDPNVVDGNDILHGGDGSDILHGDAGNDQLDGGPRGKGWTDRLYGAGGADAFFLSYNTDANEAGSEEEDFWSGVAEDWVLDDAKTTTKKIVEKLAETAAEDFFKSMTGGLLLSGFSTGVESLAVNGLKSLLFGTPPAPPPPTTEDVMVVRDFDPREDTLVLPIEAKKTLTAMPIYFASSADPEVTDRWGILFQHVDPATNAVNNFAEVFLASDFLTDAFKNEEGTTTNTPDVTNPKDADIPALFNQIMSESVTIDSNGIRDAQASYPFPTNPDAYTDGEVPDEASDGLALQAAEGGVVQIFGAFGPLSLVKPAIGSTFPTVVGTNMGDILNVNGVFFAPSDAPISQLASTGVTVKAFEGDDIVFAGNGQDFVYGFDGDDTIYGIGQSGLETREVFRGGNGDDEILLGWTSTWALADGGAGTDTVDFTYLDPDTFTGVTVDLRQTTRSGSATNTNDGFVSRYDLQNFEHVTGSPSDDVITGSDGGNQLDGEDGDDVIAGAGGNDSIHGGAGSDQVQGNDGADTYLGPQSEWIGDSLRIDSLDVLRIEGWTQNVTGDDGADGWTEVDFGDGTGFRMQPEDGTTTFDTLTQVFSDGDLLLLGPDATYDSEVLSAHLGDSAPDPGPLGKDNLVVGSSEDDKLTGGRGDDLLHGFEGSDRISGNRGNDIIVSGPGDLDISTGGRGADVFAFRDELDNGVREIDIIKDYESWPDAINLGGYEIAEYQEMSDAVLLWVGPDEDLIMVTGVRDLDRIVFVDDHGQWIDTPLAEPDTPEFGGMVDRCAEHQPRAWHAGFADLAL